MVAFSAPRRQALCQLARCAVFRIDGSTSRDVLGHLVQRLALAIWRLCGHAEPTAARLLKWIARWCAGGAVDGAAAR